MEVDYIVHGDYLLTMEDGDFVIDDGAVAVKGDRIIENGTYKELSGKYTAKKTIGGYLKAVMPGLINTHTHAAMVLMRGIADDMPLKVWLESHIWPAEVKYLSPEFINDAMELACIEMLKSGTTTFCDMYFFEDISARTTKKIGIRAVLGAGIVDFPTKTGNSREDYLKNAEEFINNWKGDELISPCIAPHSTYACSAETFEMARDIADKYGVIMHTHISETKWEVQECLAKYGKTPGMHLNDIGVLDSRLIAAHCVHITDEEISVFAKKDIGISHCIESNLKLASGIAPVPRMLNSGIKVSFGTDGAASNNDLNIMSEMSTSSKLYKAVANDPTVMPAETVLKMATKWAASSLGLGEEIGTLSAGKKADIIVLDLNKPHLTPLYNICSHIVYSMRASDVESIMVNGKLLVEEGRCLHMDEELVLDKARNWGRRLKGRV